LEASSLVVPIWPERWLITAKDDVAFIATITFVSAVYYAVTFIQCAIGIVAQVFEFAA